MKEITHELVLKMFRYDPEKGGLYYMVRPARRVRIGDRFGSINGSGRRTGRLCDRNIYEHRLVWFFHHGDWPTKGKSIDHINGDYIDNRIENLREATQLENLQNKAAHRGTRTGLTGAYPQYGGKFYAKIMKEGKSIHLGSFDTAEKAHDAYVEAKKHLHSFHPVPVYRFSQ